MASKARTPEEIAKRRGLKKTYSYSLTKSHADKLAELADRNKLPVSELVDEAIRYYLEAVGEPKTK